MVLKIDTTKQEKLTVLLQGSGVKEILETHQKPGSKALLPTILSVMKNSKIKLADLESIEANPGPGSFTGTRVGVSVANALAFALDIPVNGQKILTPKYQKTKFDK